MLFHHSVQICAIIMLIVYVYCAQKTGRRGTDQGATRLLSQLYEIKLGQNTTAKNVAAKIVTELWMILSFNLNIICNGISSQAPWQIWIPRICWKIWEKSGVLIIQSFLNESSLIYTDNARHNISFHWKLVRYYLIKQLCSTWKMQESYFHHTIHTSGEYLFKSRECSVLE